ncbi:MAG TPA: hypothetical protein VL793_02880 [Patescibacteria group bacterium]|nr:hypothetical protein [Patescibacteria group bacterium]
MPYVQSTVEMVGEVLYVMPVEGYGWGRKNEDRSYSSEDVRPDAFRMRIAEVWMLENLPNVVVGTMLDKDHLLSGWWVVLISRMDDIATNLRTEPTHCNTLIGKGKPIFKPAVRPPNSLDMALPSVKPYYLGHSIACVTPKPIEKLSRKRFG